MWWGRSIQMCIVLKNHSIIVTKLFGNKTIGKVVFSIIKICLYYSTESINLCCIWGGGGGKIKKTIYSPSSTMILSMSYYWSVQWISSLQIPIINGRRSDVIATLTTSLWRLINVGLSVADWDLPLLALSLRENCKK